MQLVSLAMPGRDSVLSWPFLIPFMLKGSKKSQPQVNNPSEDVNATWFS